MDRRHVKKTVVLVVLLLLSSGCATWNKLVERNERNEPYDPFAEMSTEEIQAFNADPSNEDKIVCEKEMPTGSHISVRICRWESEIRRRAEQDQKTVSDIQGASAGGGP